MRKESEKIGKKLLSGCVVLSMILSAMTLLVTSSEPVISQETPETYEPSLRVYGEENAVYPTQSYYGSNDFVYPEEYDPFDPGIIEKDSITFNPAFLHGHDNPYGTIIAQGNAAEKVFLRAFYEPGYTHGIDSKMDGCSDVTLYPVETFDAIVAETTYGLINYTRNNPKVGYPSPDRTEFVFPCKSTDSDRPGMEEAGIVKLMATDNDGTDQLTDGGIKVERNFTVSGSYIGQTFSFLDHEITIQNYESGPGTNDDRLDYAISYIGNMHHRVTYSLQDSIYENEIQDNDELFYNRQNTHIKNNNDPCHRWYLRINQLSNNFLHISLGRWLYAGETFYVDGVRYDMPAVYVDNTVNAQCDNGFKYITLQSPIPKADPITDDTIWYSSIDDNVDDWSHVTSQYLASLPVNDCVWLLPPFKDYHTMIDDIGLQPSACTPGDESVPLAGLVVDSNIEGLPESLENTQEPLCFYYISETEEMRFDTSLTERLNTTDEGEVWEWYNVYTQPNHYTEFVLPDQEDPDVDTYHSSGVAVDGNEYLITSSLIAPNSRIDIDRSDECKEYDEHEIFDRVNDIALNDERAEYYEMPRYTFEFDANDPTDFYINEQGSDEPSVRIYGEEDFNYPTHSYYGDDSFVYSIESDPFDPGVIAKDSITFNPAFLHGHDNPYGTIIAQGNAAEKVFLRAFYEPGYAHGIDDKMEACSNVDLRCVDFHHDEQFDAIVTETTYFLTNYEGSLPNVGYPSPDRTEFVFPYKSTDSYRPGMEEADIVKLRDTDNAGSDQLTDGGIKVERNWTFDNIDLSNEDTTVEFLDHKVVFTNFEEGGGQNKDRLDFEVSYIGNMHNQVIETNSDCHLWDTEWGTEATYEIYFDRENLYQGTTNPCHRWYVRIDAADTDYLRVSLGRWLYAGETFYVDGVRYDMPAVYVDDTKNARGDNGFKYITLQSPIPKADPITDTTVWDKQDIDNNVDDWSHVTSQYLASLPENDCVWLLPPFKDDHTMIDDIGLEPSACSPYDEEVPLAGLLIDGDRDPLCFYYIAETEEGRFDTSLTERLKTNFANDVPFEEVWEWYNVYTMPNRYTEFILPDQEDPDEDTYSSGGAAVDGNEYLITSSLIAPNSNVDTDRRDTCKDYDEHEIFSWIGGGGNGGSGFTQLAMLVDSSGSIGSTDFTTMKNGIASAIEDGDIFPHDGSVELTIVKFASGASLEANSPIIVTGSNYQTIADDIRNMAYVGGGTAMSSAFSLATTTLSGSSNFDPDDRQVVNIVTDGQPNSESSTITARNAMIATLGMDSDPDDEIDAEAIGSGVDPEWLRANIVWPQPGSIVTVPPFIPGWVRVIDSFEDFVPAIGEKFASIFVGMPMPRFVFEFDADNGTGLFINKINPGQAPKCKCKGPYNANIEDGTITLDGCNSNDPDGTIVTYKWTVDGDEYTTSNCQYYLALGNYGLGTFLVELCVTDDDGLTSCCDTTLTIHNSENNPPHCDCKGPYNANIEDGTITLDGCDSYDTDGAIENYKWTVDGETIYNGPECSYSLSLGDYGLGTYPVELCVTDDGELTTCCPTVLYVRNHDQMEMMSISIDDITIECCEGYEKAYIRAENLQEVIQININITWTSEVIRIAHNFGNFDFGTLYQVDYGLNYLHFSGMCDTTAYPKGITGDYTIGWIKFGAMASGPDTVDLEFESCILRNFTSYPGELDPSTYNAIDGTVTIGNADIVLGDMNGLDGLTFDDVVYLAMYLNWGSVSYPINPLADGDLMIDEDDNPDGQDGGCTFDDVVLLAMYLNWPTYYTIYPQMP